jgi:hypothetical protein
MRRHPMFDGTVNKNEAVTIDGTEYRVFDVVLNPAAEWVVNLHNGNFADPIRKLSLNAFAAARKGGDAPEGMLWSDRLGWVSIPQ